jgi:hypothetical protein
MAASARNQRDGCEPPAAGRQSNTSPTVPQCAGFAQSILGMRRSELGRPVSTERMNRWLDFLELQFAEVTKRCS